MTRKILIKALCSCPVVEAIPTIFTIEHIKQVDVAKACTGQDHYHKIYSYV